MNKLLKQQLLQQLQQQQGEAPPRQLTQSIPLGDIADIIAATSHLLPKILHQQLQHPQLQQINREKGENRFHEMKTVK